ncbi:Mu transposase domain-containing protein [Kitasatospora sp. NPDC052896]|uniref:Mu transposase domain-containing protein n=1 Tax=Kitasatospora sp. NPDC052896 TaxID=3364061 RepID=UPI0037CC1641
MLTLDEYLELLALNHQGWSIAEISRRLGRDRKTVSSYVKGRRVPEKRRTAQDESLRYLSYCRQRLAEDPHLPARCLYTEIVELGYPGAYSTFTRVLRNQGLRPPCPECAGRTHEGEAVASAPSEATVRFDWVELPESPPGWGRADRAHLLVGLLPHSGRWRAALAEGVDLAHLAEAIDQVLRRLGGTPGCWVFDRATAVFSADSAKVAPPFAAVARHYGVRVLAGPPGGGRCAACGAIRATIRRWWSGTVAAGGSVQAAQRTLDQLAACMDTAGRLGSHLCVAGQKVAGNGPLLPLPDKPVPLWVCSTSTVSADGLVRYQGNSYAVPRHLTGARLEVRRRLDRPYISIATAGGAVIACYELAAPARGLTVTNRCDAIMLQRPYSSTPPAVARCKAATRSQRSSDAPAQVGFPPQHEWATTRSSV